MAPTKPTKMSLSNITGRPTVSTRSRSNMNNLNIYNKEARPKRKADASPTKDAAAKRSALGDLTNDSRRVKLLDGKGKPALDSKSKPTLKHSNSLKKVVVQSKMLASVKSVAKSKQQNENVPPAAPKVTTRAAVRNSTAVPDQTALKPKENGKESTTTARVKRLSDEFEKTGESLYSSALENISESDDSTRCKSRSSSICSDSSIKDGEHPSNVSLIAQKMAVTLKLNLGNHNVPIDVEDFDKENWDDVFQCSHYAMDIFYYLKQRETQFVIPDYMGRQVCLTAGMRTLLVDWMVEIQESFELNHETLYLGVKLVDMYLSQVTVSKETLQLVGAAAIFIASKFDERMPPLVDDFLYICDGAYTRRELIRMEINLLKVINYDLGIPISYRFLRRYARCAKVAMPILTLARYVLELSLMDYATVTLRDSKLACGALFLALRMSRLGGWSKTLEFYSGYKLEEFKEEVLVLNNYLHKKPKDQVSTVRNKYSHKIFFEVAKAALIKNEELFN